MSEVNELQMLREKVERYVEIIRNMSTPIIPSIVPSTILIPIAGYIDQTRFEAIRSKTLAYIGNSRDTERAIFDFTGVTIEDVASFDYNSLASEIFQLNDSMALMGVRPIYVGFNPRFVREIVHAGIQVEIETYVTFRAALQQLIRETSTPLASM
ncbi:STAS domain-containing protein [Paenisporosarcina cavernae]|uniref:STAS domain-containing protein n=1 Tax=Paenisporosarcina cavernae TaxID=2320858 RepID=A0A385YUV1_9BACL|nr:STAS domain-containing protein [Paenisporosarcina cavernae]AYC30060.1 STAS domain-containing protein [Paenisporosarcina cavernae]